MIRAFALLVAILTVTVPARGEELVAGLSQTSVALTADFEGMEILVYGAVRREVPIPAEGPPLGIIITIEGPSTPLTVWRKARRAGIWVNTDAVRIGSAPSFYAVASTGPLDAVLSATEDLRHRISIPRAIRAIGTAAIADAPVFTDALIRIREEADLYQTLEGEVIVDRETLFSTKVSLPANLTEGVYSTRIFLTRGGAVIDDYTTQIDVRKVGLERLLFQLAQEEPLIYGILAVLLAVAAGWGASQAFRYIRA